MFAARISVIITGAALAAGTPDTVDIFTVSQVADPRGPGGSVTQVTGNAIISGDQIGPVGTSRNYLYEPGENLWFPEWVYGNAAAVTIAGAGNTQVAALGAERICIDHVSLAMSGATNLSLVQGTGANCAVGTVALTGPYTNVTALNLDIAPHSILCTTVDAQALCVSNTAAVTGGGLLTFNRVVF